MTLEYFGVVDHVFGDHSQLARIRVLARVVDDSRRIVTAQVRDVGPEAGLLLAAVSAAPAEVVDVTLEGSTLQDVFIALTGRELRE